MNSIKFLIKFFIAISLTLLLAGCLQTTTEKGSVGIERQQMMFVSAAEMEQGSIKAYNQILEQARKDNTLNPDKEQLLRLRNIADRLIPKTKVFREDAPNWDWQVNIIKSEQINAWCMPGGRIVFYTGIIDRLNLNDDEIAAIMGHEIAHALREHGRERASQAQLQGVGLALLSILAGIDTAGIELASMVMDVTFALPNSREHEIEADRMGVELAARAGFDPFAAVGFWEKIKAKSGDTPPEFLSTHPSSENRVKDLKKYALKVQHLIPE